MQRLPTILVAGAIVSGAGSWWTNTLSLATENSIALAATTIGSGLLVVDWFGKKAEVQRRVWRSVTRFAGHEAVRMLLAAAAVVACFHFGNNIRYARHVLIDCEEPKVDGFVLRAGRRNITDACGGASVWVDRRAPIQASAPNRLSQRFDSIDDAPVDRQGNKTFRLAIVERRPWVCTIKRDVPDDPRRCNESGKGAWKHASRVHLALSGDPAAATEELRFVLRSEDPARYGVGVAGIGGCVVSPADRDSPAVELEATPECVKLHNDGKKAVELATFLCSNGDAAPASLSGVARLAVAWKGSGAELEVPCSR